MPKPQIQGISSESPENYTSRRQDSSQKVFVYGTLKKGYGNHLHYLQHAKFLGIAMVEGIMFHLGGFPAINLGEQFSKISGEVYDCTWDDIVAMDILEGVGNDFYDRVQTRVKPFGVVWTYVFSRDKAIAQRFVVPSGCWRGPSTPKAKWEGFGKGVTVGSFETNTKDEEIKIGGGEGDYFLLRSGFDHLYRIVNKKTGDVLGPYKVLSDLLGMSHPRKPLLALPKPAEAHVPTVDLGERGSMAELVMDAVTRDIDKYNPPPKQLPAIVADLKEEEEEIPQAARLFSIKYGAA